MGQSPHKGPSLTRDAWPHSTWRQRRYVSEMDRKWAADQQTRWTACHQNDPRADQLCQPTLTPVHHPPPTIGDEAEHSRLKSGPPLMRRLSIHKNIPASVTKLTQGRRVGFIISQTWQWTNSSLLTESDHGSTKDEHPSCGQKHACIDHHPRLILVTHTDDLGWNKTSYQ